MKKVLLIRLDKIGDLISTMCVDQTEFMKDCESSWVIAKGLGFVPDHSIPSRKYLELSKEDWKVSFKKLREYLKSEKPEVAVSFQTPWWVNAALWLAGVPVRAGVLSQWHSFLFLNRGLRQKRSKSVQHEADYNLDLLAHAMGVANPQKPAPVLKLQAKPFPGLLEKLSLGAHNYVIVHPGMAGSALNWPTENYIALIDKILPLYSVALTGTAMDEPYLAPIKAHFQNNPKVHNLQNLLKTPELLSVLSQAKAVVVPSTGVAHMAASLGAPVLGLYSPLRVQHPRRWAARGARVSIFVAGAEGPDCMNEITVEQVYQKLTEL
jgi:ADP-heptose:LPS heptosyltransferase